MTQIVTNGNFGGKISADINQIQTTNQISAGNRDRYEPFGGKVCFENAGVNQSGTSNQISSSGYKVMKIRTRKETCVRRTSIPNENVPITMPIHNKYTRK